MNHVADVDHDRRQHPRVVMEGIHGNMLNAVDLEVLNISLGGAAIITQKRVELNREYTVRLHCMDGTFQVRVMVIWATLISRVRHDETITPLYKAGVQFINVSEEKTDMLRKCIVADGNETNHRSLSRITYCF